MATLLAEACIEASSCTELSKPSWWLFLAPLCTPGRALGCACVIGVSDVIAVVVVLFLVLTLAQYLAAKHGGDDRTQVVIERTAVHTAILC